MGRKQALIAARKACYVEPKVYEEEAKPDYALQEEMKNIKYEDTAFDIRQRLFEFCEEGGYPLCEYLDMDSVLNYIDHILATK